MTANALQDLLREIHHSIDRVADDLARDRPALAEALRQEAAWIPRPEPLMRGARAPSGGAAACSSLRPLLYEALDEGAVDAHHFDALMLCQAQAARRYGERDE
jgi:hypothetical protein